MTWVYFFEEHTAGIGWQGSDITTELFQVKSNITFKTFSTVFKFGFCIAIIRLQWELVQWVCGGVILRMNN